MTEQSSIQGLLDDSETYEPASLQVMSLENFLNYKFPKREFLLSPIISSQSLSMVFAKTGVGKTFFALSVAYAISSGGSFLGWSAPKPRKVLYLDGEMAAHVMQERLRKISSLSDKQVPPGYFQLITPDMQKMGMSDISTKEGQDTLEPQIKDAEFIVIDNISTLVRTGKENEAQDWLLVQGWILNLRSRGKSVLLVHHAGKNGNQRGTSRREDVLDLVISLERPSDHKPNEGARFKINFTKARHFSGDQSVESFEAHLSDEGWKTNASIDQQKELLLDLYGQGKSLREIQQETGISKSKIQRVLADRSAS